MKNISLDITPGAYFYFAIALLLFPAKLVFAWILAAAIHETAHLLVLGNAVLGVQIGAGGAIIKTQPLSNRKEFFAAFAGPMLSLVSVGLYKIFPLLAVCSFVQFLFNILPVFPMDGGRMFRSALRAFWGERIADNILRHWQKTVSALMLTAIIFLIVKTRHIYFLIACGIWIIRLIFGKRPCKYKGRGVQ